MDSRRKVLQKIGLGTAAASLVVAGVTAPGGSSVKLTGAAAPQPGEGPRDPAGGSGPWWILAPLTRGDHLGGGWFLAHLGGVQRGAAVLTLQHRDAGVARVHLCHHDGAPKGLAHSEFIDMILMDGARGDQPTDENLGRVLMGLAQVVRGNELNGDGDLGQLAQMQPHVERVQDHGPENLT